MANTDEQMFSDSHSISDENEEISMPMSISIRSDAMSSSTLNKTKTIKKQRSLKYVNINDDLRT